MSTKTGPLSALAVGLTLLAAACGTDNDGPPTAGQPTAVSSTAIPAQTGASLTISSPASGATVEGNVVSLDLEAEGIDVVSPDGDTSGETGHFHVFVDAEPVRVGETIPRGPGIVHSADDPITLYGMTTGQHRLVVVLGDGTHQRIHGDVEEELMLTVAGPSVDVTAPPTAKAGEPVIIDAAVDGIDLVKADGDTSGTTGHLHLFVDREPTPPGQPIPAEPGIIHTVERSVPIPDLAAGEHTVWAVVGDGSHVPLEPMVADKVTVTVG